MMDKGLQDGIKETIASSVFVPFFYHRPVFRG